MHQRKGDLNLYEQLPLIKVFRSQASYSEVQKDQMRTIYIKCNKKHKNNRKHLFIFSCSSEMFANATNAFDKVGQYLCIMQPLIQKRYLCNMQGLTQDLYRADASRTSWGCVQTWGKSKLNKLEENQYWTRNNRLEDTEWLWMTTSNNSNSYVLNPNYS